MNIKRYSKAVVLIAAIMSLVAVLAYGQADKKGRKEFPFKGKVEKVDPNAKTISVNNESIPGWMNSMTMTYTVDKPDVLKTLKPGDQISAKVYEGDFKTLYEVKPIAPGNERKAEPKK